MKHKRLRAAFLAVCMALTLLPPNVLAAEVENPATEPAEEQALVPPPGILEVMLRKRKRRRMQVILCP